MAIFKCKMCGGTLEIQDGQTIGKCEYCGTVQTLPRLDDDRRANLYDRANHFRRNNEFDKAMGIYEQILNEDNTDAESYWSLVLCRYGIEYVEEPITHKRVPTVNRAQYTSIFDDDNYKSALQYASIEQKLLYEEEAKTINEIQKGILAISEQEEPFDVFISYKETDNNGRRTVDSVLANDLYHQLTQEGFKVFFSRITLEDKLGSAYEPYIFSALNSAKVMVVLGTKSEYFSAVWVKNEWSRYLSLIKQGKKKILIPAYKDMDPYDLPEEFSHLQAQDMSKLGFMQDLIRGIKKITQKEETMNNRSYSSNNSNQSMNINNLLKRVFLFLEDEEWEAAEEYCEKVLNIDYKNAQAYLGKMMVDYHIKSFDELSSLDIMFDNNKNYKRIIAYGDKQLISKLNGFLSCISNKVENSYLEKIYYSALNKKNNAVTEKDYKECINLFANIIDYKNTKQMIDECSFKIEEIYRKKELRYNNAVCLMNNGKYDEANNIFKDLGDYKDSLDRLAKLINLKFKNAKVGDSIKFGKYLQSDTKSEEIEWLVLDVKKSSILVISKYGLDCKPYNNIFSDVTWKYCSLRKWLNSDFLNSAFSEKEKSMILDANVSSDKNPKYHINSGSRTQEQVFLLSATEVNKYFCSDNDRKCIPTNYAMSKGVQKSVIYGTYCCWWLRTPGRTQNYAAGVNYNGSVGCIGYEVNHSDCAIRPALWINISD